VLEDLTIERADIASEAATALIAALNEELTLLYPEEGANHFDLTAAQVATGRGAFLVAYSGGVAVGCGAVRLMGDGVEAEIKRMFVVPEARRRGISRGILAALEDAARSLGAQRVLLETGVRQPPAIGLYESADYEHIEPFAEYIGSPYSVCMAKMLAAG
jgi:putative acetyltransferase